MNKVSISELKRCVAYDPLTGIMTWKDRLSPKSRAVIGTEIGYVDQDGYLRFKFMGQKLYVHVAAWAIVTGAWPTTEIDHRDVDPDYNAWTNLREATRSQNKANMGPPKTNTSGIKGVRYEADRDKWVARITHHGQKKNLGRFDTRDEAAHAYAVAANAHFGEFARTHECA
jgi:hypothetical protein